MSFALNSQTIPERAHLQFRSLYAAERTVMIWLRFILGSWAITLILHELEIGGQWMPVASSTWIFILGWVALYAASYLAFHQTARATQRPILSQDAKLATTTMILMGISAFGAALVIFDFAVLRGYGLGTSAALIRALEADAAIKGLNSSSAVSGVGRLMLPAALPAFVLLVSNPRSLSPTQKSIAAVFGIILLYEQLFFEGGRFFLTISAAIALITYFTRLRLTRGSMKLNISAKAVMLMLVGSVLMLTFFSYVFVTRIAERDDFFWSAYRGFTSYFAIDVDVNVIARFEGVFGSIWFSLSMLWLYATQGINEIDAVFALSSFNHAHGLYQFPHFGQIAQMVFGIEWRYDMIANLPTTGTYLTMPGANYVDFGLTGMFVSAIIFGGLSAWSMHRFASGHQTGFALCGPILIAVALFSPVVSLFTTVWPAFFWCVIYNMIRSSRG